MSVQTIKTITYVKWRPIEGFPGYSVSNNGMVRRDKKLIKIYTCNARGYAFICITIKGPGVGLGTFKRFDLHKVVWDAFGDKPSISGFQIHHKDKNKLNNHIDNLELLSYEAHLAKHNRKSRKAA